MRFKFVWLTLNCVGLLLCVNLPVAAQPITAVAVKLPGGDGGIGFDDMGFAPLLHMILVPAGRTGNLDLIDPATKQVTAISGFSSRPFFGGEHEEGVTSADEGGGLLFATDRDATQLNVIDPKTKSVVARVPLASIPDYVRFVDSRANFG